jgi:hypothetical protein
MRKIFPGIAVRAVILAHRAPLAFAQVRPPAAPFMIGPCMRDAAAFYGLQQMTWLMLRILIGHQFTLLAGSTMSRARRVMEPRK